MASECRLKSVCFIILFLLSIVLLIAHLRLSSLSDYIFNLLDYQKYLMVIKIKLNTFLLHFQKKNYNIYIYYQNCDI